MALVITSDIARSLTLRRFAAGSVVSGNWVPGTTTDTTFTGTLQPHAGGVSTQIPSSGKRRRADVVVYTEASVGFLTAAQSSTQQADRIVDPLSSVVYEVIGTKRFYDVLPHEVAYCVRIDEATT